MKKPAIGIVCVFVLFGVFIWCGAAAFAQESDPDSFILEEITVTAEKRETNLQKTSISMSVIEGEALQNTGATTVDDILKNIPNVTTSDSGTSGGYSINIRGLGNDMPTGMGESSVSINYDGAYDARGESTLFGFFDVDRVEVLRGPQGTLYGRNATGGVMNVVSARPDTEKVSGYASLELAEYEKTKAEAAINVPMGTNFAGRLAFVSVKQEGATKDDHGYRDPVSGLATRLQIGYIPNDETSVNLLYSYTEKDGESWVDIDRTVWDAGTYDVNRNSYYYHLTNREKVKNTKFSLNADFKVGPGILSVIPTYQTTKGWSSSYSIERGNTEPSFNTDRDPYDYEAKIGEVRYANSEDSDILWTVGLYYTKTDDPVYPDADRGGSQEFQSTAAFGQITYPFSDTLRGIAGLRYDATEKGYYDSISYLYDSYSESWSYVDYKLGIENDFSDKMMGYFTLASGHKAGGFDDDGLPFDMESNISGELGVKSRFLDNRLQVNADVFYYIYDGYQVADGYAELDAGSGEYEFFVNFTNADKAMSQGAEIETTTLLGNSTVLTLNFTYLKNEYTEDFWVHPDAYEDAVNLKGVTMPHSPEFTIQAGIDHSFFLPNGATIKPSLNYRWTDEQYAAFLILPQNLAPDYAVLDVGLSYIAAENWSLNFYANNALDEHYYTMLQGDGEVVFPGNPRIMGVTLNYNF